MKKRILHILNWDKYQARSDKELPWLKLWGRLFKTPWFQLLQDEEKFVTIALLDLARQFNNNIPQELIFKGYLRGNYGVFMSQERITYLTQVLVTNDFLSDNCPTNVEVEGDKIRVDKTRQEGVGLFFETFFSKYPKKQGKADALKAFKSLSITNGLFEEVLSALAVQARTEAWLKDGGKFIPLPASWLRGRRWEDQLTVENGLPKSTLKLIACKHCSIEVVETRIEAHEIACGEQQKELC